MDDKGNSTALEMANVALARMEAENRRLARNNKILAAFNILQAIMGLAILIVVLFSVL